MNTCLDIVALDAVECVLQDYSTQALACKGANDFEMPLVEFVNIDSFSAPNHNLLAIESNSPELSITAQLHRTLSVTDCQLIWSNLNGTHLRTKLSADLEESYMRYRVNILILNIEFSPAAL
jgi:hypothetical protein